MEAVRIVLWKSHSLSSLFHSCFMDKMPNSSDLLVASWSCFLKCFNKSMKSYKGRDNIFV